MSRLVLEMGTGDIESSLVHEFQWNRLAQTEQVQALGAKDGRQPFLHKKEHQAEEGVNLSMQSYKKFVYGTHVVPFMSQVV